MPSISSWLSDISRRKLRTVASGRDGLQDTINLHRFVLLKNSITHASESPAPSSPSSQSSLLVQDEGRTEVLISPDVAPRTPSLGHRPDTSSNHDSEEKWLESVLETLDDDFDGDVEVEVHQVNDDDLDFLDSSQDSFESWGPPFDACPINHPLPIPSDNFLSAPSPVLSSQLQSPTSLQFLFNSPNSHFNQPYVEPRYPEADLDLPISETNSDSESDDDGPLTPYSGSQPSLGEQATTEPEVYVEHDCYFLYPSELDPISPPIYYQQC